MELIEKIKRQKEKIFTSTGENVKIDSIMIDENGELSSYFYKNDDLHEMRSISKIMIDLAYGIAIDRKMLVYGKPITTETDVYPIFKNLTKIRLENVEKIKKWKIKTLLTYSAGYDTQMFSEKFIKGLDDKTFIDYVLNYDLPNEPNEKYVYNNAEIFLLSVFFQEAFEINISDFIAKEIFNPLGIKKFIWKNYDKYCPGGTGLYISHKDLFKIGQLILHKGNFNGKQIISQKNIEEMCSTQIDTPYAVKPERVLPKIGVGYIMHISRDGYIFKDGTNGQYLIINFNKNLLISILSSEKEMKYVTEILRDLI